MVITGLGVVSPLGNDINALWANLIAGKCGVQRITQFDPTLFDTQIAAFQRVEEVNYGLVGRGAGDARYACDSRCRRCGRA